MNISYDMVDGSIILFHNTSCHIISYRIISYQNTLLHIMQSHFYLYSSNCHLPLIIPRNETYLRTASSMYVHPQHMPTQLQKLLLLNIEFISILNIAINMKSMSYFVLSCLFFSLFFSFLFFSFLFFSFLFFYFQIYMHMENYQK